jgi:hypothetical protein
MKEVFIISENEEIYLMISNALSYLPVHFSWVGDMDKAENQFRSEKPDLVFFAVRKLTLLHNWIARFKSFKLKIPFICFVSKIGWDKRELLWMAGSAQVIELPKLKKEFGQIMESILVQQDHDKSVDQLTGHLSVFNVIDLIQTFEDGKKNGILEIKSKNKIGQLYFTRGELVNASYGKNDPLQSIKIMCSWRDGVFRAELDKVPHKKKINLNNQDVIRECQNHLLEREKIISAFAEKDTEYYSAPLLDYENLGFLERKNILFFKKGATISDFIDQEEEGSLRVLKEIKKWLKNGWLVKRDEYKEQTNKLREQEKASGVMKMINKMFSKGPELIKSTSLSIDDDTFFDEDEHTKTEKKPYLFSDKDYLQNFLEILKKDL